MMSVTGVVQDNNDAVNVRNSTDAAAAAERDVIDEDNDDELSNQLRAFARAPARKSLGNNAALLGWLDAQERLQNRLDDNEVRWSTGELSSVDKTQSSLEIQTEYSERKRKNLQLGQIGEIF